MKEKEKMALDYLVEEFKKEASKHYYNSNLTRLNRIRMEINNLLKNIATYEYMCDDK